MLFQWQHPQFLKICLLHREYKMLLTLLLALLSSCRCRKKYIVNPWYCLFDHSTFLMGMVSKIVDRKDPSNLLLLSLKICQHCIQYILLLRSSTFP